MAAHETLNTEPNSDKDSLANPRLLGGIHLYN
jgi:hypothetical protein